MSELNNLSAYLSDIKFENTAHSVGLKKVFINSVDTNSSITQFAFGLLSPGESSDWHRHPTMIESFFFMKGEGKCYIEKEMISILPNTFVTIPANANHMLMNSGQSNLEFIYFGVEVKNEDFEI